MQYLIIPKYEKVKLTSQVMSYVCAHVWSSSFLLLINLES